MAYDNQEASGTLPTKKEMKKVVTDKLHTALPDMKTSLGEKKFSRRLKKAVKMLLHGIHNEDVLKKAKKIADTNRVKSAKKLAVKTAKTANKTKKAKAALPEIFAK